jgi:mono/diheme cytochrome c family protein
MMKDWILISLCALFTSAMAIASPQNVSESAASETSEVQTRRTDASTATAVATTSPASSADPAQVTPAVESSTGASYIVEDGNKVDTKTLTGWKTWRAMACERCHGAAQEGLVGPALVESLKILTKEQFHTTIMNGRPAKGMPPFSSSKMVTDNWEGLYAYLKGRSDGQILPGRLSPLDTE